MRVNTTNQNRARLRIADCRLRTRQSALGFTLIELLLVLVILGILAAIVVPKFSGRTEQARMTAAQSQISTFNTALDAFEVDNGYYPKGRNGLVDLVQPPRDSQNWRGPYLKSAIPNDPWGRPYIYECPGKHNPSSYDLSSMGPDGRSGNEDDITNWQTDRR
ncbi:MAG: type II secretion system protein GspG [Acidobacteria bacterium]|nr:MAG: type II secretion system protein GspG [Acidobacteriota bacterium]